MAVTDLEYLYLLGIFLDPKAKPNSNEQKVNLSRQSSVTAE